MIFTNVILIFQAVPVTRLEEQEKEVRTNSPPPHIIGQIVEMGFSPEQARLALASTDTGLDVQQALDILLSNGAGADHEPEPVLDRPRRLSDSDLEEAKWEDRGQESPRIQHQVQRQASGGPSRVPKQAQALIGEDIQERADKLLAQIGRAHV